MAKKQENIESKLQVCAIKDLPITQPDKIASSEEFSVCVRAIQLNRRQGTVSCKDRGEVNKTNKKPWKQKGTGRARAGSARSPLWRGGGIIFGPQMRVHTHHVSKRQSRRVLASMLFDFIEKQKIAKLHWEPNTEKPKTADIYNVLREVGIENKRVVFFVPAHDDALHKSLSNIPFVSMLLFDQPNPLDLSKSDMWIYLKRDQEQFNNMVAQWI